MFSVHNSPLGLCALSPTLHWDCVLCPELSTGTVCSVPNSQLGLCSLSTTLHWDCVLCPQLSTGTVCSVPNSLLGLCALFPTLNWDCVLCPQLSTGTVSCDPNSPLGLCALSTTLHWDCVLCPQVLDDWNKGELSSFLIEITRDIVKFTDPDGQPLLEKIRDTAGQVGQWVIIGLDRNKIH